MGVLNLSTKDKEDTLKPITINGLRVASFVSLSIHAEYTEGKNHLSWCVWEQTHYGYLAPVYLKDAGKIKHSKAIGPDIQIVIEKIAPNQVICLRDDPLIQKIMKNLITDEWQQVWLNETLMDDETLMKAKETLSQEWFRVPASMKFEPDLIFDEEFNYCTLSNDAVKHDDTILLLSKACAVGCLYFDWRVNSIWWR